MPFTFSHPAIVLPLYRMSPRWLSMTGLIVGSIIPDFEYFIRMRLRSAISHSVPGLFMFDLPLGILVAFIFHNIVRNQLFDNSPQIVRRRFDVFTTFNWNSYFKTHWFGAIISVLIGACSHLLWDGFTHGRLGSFINFFPVLGTDVLIFGNSIPIYRVLQHVSTVVGGLTVMIFFLRMPHADITSSNGDRKYWPLVAVLTLIIVILRFIVRKDADLIGPVVVAGISATMISLIVVSLVLRKKRIS
ncbi:DUF4184 family protein [soil metagenome]